MEITNLLWSLRDYYVDNPVITSVVIAVLTTLGIIAYDVLNHYMGKIKKPIVRELNIYPIKSCAETRVGGAAVTALGFRNDRIFQVVSKVDGKWRYCTPREKKFEKLFHVVPVLSVDKEGIKLRLSSPHRKGTFVLDLEDAITSRLVASVMGDKEFALVDYGDDVSKWLGDATDIDNPRLVSIPPGDGNFRRLVEVNPDQGEALPSSTNFPVSLADEAPFLLTTLESLGDLNKRLGLSGEAKVDMRRFRPNIVIDGMWPWEEDSLKRIRIGSVEFHVWQRCGRCTMTTIDRDSLERGGEPLKTLSTFRERKNGQRNFGMHMIPVMDEKGDENGMNIKVGDEVEILEYDDERREEWTRLFRMPIFGKTGGPKKKSNAEAKSAAPKKKKPWRERMKECPFKDNEE